MVKIENHCVDCTGAGMHCLGSGCPNRRVEVHYCDVCGEEADYWAEGEDLCEYCLQEKFRRKD